MERDIRFLVLGIVLGVALFSGSVQGYYINEFYDWNYPLVGYWSFEHVLSNGTVYDNSTYGNDGTLYNHSTNTTVTGKYGQGLEFDGVDDYINVGDDSSLNFGTGEITIESWIKTEGSGIRGIYSKEERIVGNEGLLLQVNNDGKARFDIWNSSDGTFVTTINAINDGIWHHLVTIRNSTNLSIYIDGILEAVSVAKGINADVSDDALIGVEGQTPLAWWFNGTIDEVRIYNRALSEEEINALYNTNLMYFTEKNLTYTEAGSQLVYITIPKNASYGYFTSATLNLSGFEFNETVDAEDEGFGDDECRDEDWSTFCVHSAVGNNRTTYENYTDVKSSIAVWKFKYNISSSLGQFNVSYWNYSKNDWSSLYDDAAESLGPENITVQIPSDGLTGSKFRIRTHQKGGIGLPTLYYEGEITWELLPTNITIDTSNDGTIDWNLSGELNSTNSPQQADLNSSVFNEFLRDCTADANGYCDLPLNISSDTAGILQLDNLNITYNFDNLLIACGGISNTTALNFSVFGEENNTESIRSDFEAEFDVTITALDITSNMTFDITNKTYLEVCIYPSWGEYIIDATLKYTNNPNQSVNYSTRYYFFQSASIDNITDDIFLYLLEESDSNQITFVIKNIYNLPQERVIVKVTRFFISDDVYRQVDMGLSDFDGEATTQLKLNEWYIFIIEQDGQILRIFSQKFLTSTGDITLFTESGTQVEYFTYFDSLGASCTPNNATSLLTCTFSDTSGKMVELNLTIEKRQLVGGFLTICTNTTTASSGTISCSYTGNNDTELAYSLAGRFCCSQITFFTILTGVISGAIAAPFGTIGVIVMLFIIIASVLFGFWNPAVPIVMGLFGIVIGMVLQLIVISSISVLSLVIAGGIIVYKMRT